MCHYPQVKWANFYTLIPWNSKVAQSCLTLCHPMDCSLPGSSVHGIFQARILEWLAISFSRESSWPRDRTWVSRIAGRRFNLWATREAPREPQKLQDTKLIYRNLLLFYILILNYQKEKARKPFFFKLHQKRIFKKP